MIRGALFTRYFLEDGIRETPAYRGLSAATVAAFAASARGLWDRFDVMHRPLESETEQQFIYPMLDLLGWHYLTQQEPGQGRRDVADALLFLDDGAMQRASRLRASADRFRLGVVVVENEARDTRLDRGSGAAEAPSSQIIRYLRRAETESDGAVNWGLLTGGRLWRLYFARHRSRAEGFVELDLPALLDEGEAEHWARVFLLLFSRDALAPHGADRRTFLDDALAEGRRYEQRVTAALSRVVFDRVFPDLVAAIAREPGAAPADAAWRGQAREAALRLLYRLLFLFYAEDRDLLPFGHDGYRAYGLRGLREEAARIADDGRALSARARTWWPRLAALFAAIANGDPGMGLPPYNGGLFHDADSGLLARLSLPDGVLAPLVDLMSREQDSSPPRWINYRDLSVQQLGAIYERLLERDVVAGDGGGVALRVNAFARRTTGSYYTPDELVQLILRRAVGPLLEERRAAFAARADALRSDRRAKAERLAELPRLDPAEAFLSLRVCDPAMGSGHFLVSLVDYVADEVLTALTAAPAMVDWADAEHPYRSPLSARIEALRARIHAEARANGWAVRDDQLDDRHLVRRIVLKRVIYGVDANPMAVELAKLSLWLHSFTVGAPLSFLDHHLRCGDSLFGEFVGPVEQDLRTRFGLAMSQAVVRARKSAEGMAAVEALTDADIGEVRASAMHFAGVEEGTAELRAFLDLYHAIRWAPPKDASGELGALQLLGGAYGDPVALASGAPMTPSKGGEPVVRLRRLAVPAIEAREAAAALLATARLLSDERRFLHWEAAFPGVWDEWESARPTGGFDAVIGNPPWDRMKMQEVEWFAARVPAIALAQRASDRARMIRALRTAGDPMAETFAQAAATAEAATRVARDGGAYPLLSGGDVNIYSLFVERAARLLRPEGIVGLLVPSGIAADKGAAPFFRSVSTTGRLAALLDFENGARKPEPFFPDVHRSFKFCALVFGGPARRFAEAACAFFKSSATQAETEAFALTPADFAAVNPNTGTAPVFRTPRDAEITRAIYARLPVLVDRSGAAPVSVWPVRYERMFDMTNDSGKFRTARELERDGAYRVAGGRWERGDESWLPLYEGKMVQAFDHRAASVVVNAANVKRPAQPVDASAAEHEDADWKPNPQFWVSVNDFPTERLPWTLAVKHVSSPTNVRTMISTICPSAGFGNSLPIIPDTLPTTHTTCGGLSFWQI